MFNLPDNAKPIKNSGDKFSAFISRNGDCAYVIIFKRTGKYDIDFSYPVANYETVSHGATHSARREIERLSK